MRRDLFFLSNTKQSDTTASAAGWGGRDAFGMRSKYVHLRRYMESNDDPPEKVKRNVCWHNKMKAVGVFINLPNYSPLLPRWVPLCAHLMQYMLTADASTQVGGRFPGHPNRACGVCAHLGNTGKFVSRCIIRTLTFNDSFLGYPILTTKGTPTVRATATEVQLSSGTRWKEGRRSDLIN